MSDERGDRASEPGPPGVAQLFDALFEHAIDGVLLTRTDGAVLRANPSACQALARTEAEIRREGRDGLIVQDDRLRAMFADREASGKSRGEVTFRRPDGSTFPAEIASTVISTTGEGGYAYAIFRDVTRQRRDEERLRESEQRFRDVAASAGEYIFEMDAQGVLTYVSDATDAVLGYRPEEMLGQSSFRFMTEAEQTRSGPYLAERVERKDPISHHQQEAVHRSGRKVWLDVSAVPVLGKDGALLAYRGVVMDVTERRQAESAIRRSELLYKTIARNYPHGIIGLFGHDLRLILNEGASPVLVKDTSWALGKTPMEFAPPDVAPAVDATYRQALAGRPGHLEARLRGRTVDIRTFPVRDETGEVILGLVMTEDVTDRRAAQDQLLVASRLAALGTLVAGVAHEINNPLNGCTVGVAMAMEELRELRASIQRGELRDPDATTRLLDHVLSDLDEANGGAHRIARIVKDLETLGRPDPERTRTQLGFVVEEAMRWMPAFVATRADVRVERDGSPDVLASSGQLAQVVVNLVTNAARAIAEGKRGRVTIRVGTGGAGGAVLEVEDDGVGMPPAVMARIYDPFFTTRPVGDGKGLGLAVTHAIVKAHGGAITVRSEPGQGSTFRVELPAAPAVERSG